MILTAGPEGSIKDRQMLLIPTPACRQNISMMLGHDAFRRLLIGFILREQKAANKEGLIQKDQVLSAVIAGKTNAEIDAIEVNEDVLGFDSLGILELITALNQFFGLSTTGIEDYFLLERRIGAWIDLLDKHQKISGDTATFGFQTSGSTGAPKLIRHSAKALWSELRAQIEDPFAHFSPPGRIITLVPPHHIYGFLFSCVLPELLSCAVIDLSNAAPGAAFRHAQPGDLIVGTPFHWALLGKSGLQFCENVSGVTSAGPSAAHTWDVLKTNSLSRMTEVYGATETAGIGFRTAQSDTFHLLSHLKVSDGTISLKATGDILIAQDTLSFATPTTFRVGERIDDVVQVAGVNVSPRYVRDQIMRVDGVADASVRLGAERLRAFVVPAPGVDEAILKLSLCNHVAKTLEPPARPASFSFGTELPLTEMGKAADWV